MQLEHGDSTSYGLGVKCKGLVRRGGHVAMVCHQLAAQAHQCEEKSLGKNFVELFEELNQGQTHDMLLQQDKTQVFRTHADSKVCKYLNKTWFRPRSHEVLYQSVRRNYEMLRGAQKQQCAFSVKSWFG